MSTERALLVDSPITKNRGGSVTILLTLCAVLSGSVLAQSNSSNQAEQAASEGSIPFVRYASASANGSGWWFSPVDIKFSSDDGKQDWSRVPTKELYKLKPLGFYGVDAELETDFFSLDLAYERGGGISTSLSSSSLLAFVLQLHGIPQVDRLRFSSTILDFVNGQALLLDRQTGSTVDEASFELRMRRFSLSYQLPKARIVGEYLGYNIPRNIYLQQKQGSGDSKSYIYYPISDQLMRVGSNVFLVGFATDNRENEFKNGLLQPYDRDQPMILGGSILLGGGPYKITHLGSDEVIDKGSLVAIGLTGNVLLQKRFWKYVTIGGLIDTSFYFFQPIGLPDDMEAYAKSEDVQADDLSVNFGTVDVLARAYGFIRVDY